MEHRFTEAVETAINKAFLLAEKEKNTEVQDSHLLLSFLEEPQGYFNALLKHLKIDPLPLIEALKEEIKKGAKWAGNDILTPNPSLSLQNRIKEAEAIAKSWKDEYTSSDHFLISYWKGGSGIFNNWKSRTKISLNQLEETIKKMR